MVKGEGERERTIENSHWLVRGPVYKKHLGEFYLHLPISVECQWRSEGENRCKTALVLKGTTFRHHCLNRFYTNSHGFCNSLFAIAFCPYKAIFKKNTHSTLMDSEIDVGIQKSWMFRILKSVV